MKLLAAALLALVSIALPVNVKAANPADVVEMRTVYDLLTQTFYRPLPARQVLQGAQAGVVAYLREHGVRSPRIPAPSAADVSQATGYLDKIVSAASAQSGRGSTEISYAALHGMARSAHDRWTEYFDPAEYRQFDAPLDPPNLSGIGVLTNPDAATHYTQVFFVIPGSPADAAGLRVSDEIVSVDGVSMRGLDQPAVSKHLRGAAGSTVHLTVRRGSQMQNVSIVRAQVRPPTVYFTLLPKQIGYIDVAVFGAPTADEFSQALERLRQQGARAFIVDLREDGGGYVTSAVSVASHFISSGPIVSSISRDGSTITAESNDELPQVSEPTAVLVNQDTASASEIAASALRDNHVAVLIGTRTFGKGVEQTVSRLPDGSAIKITTQRYLTADNRDLNGVGIEPDMRVTENAHPTIGQVNADAQLEAAVRYIETKLES